MINNEIPLEQRREYIHNQLQQEDVFKYIISMLREGNNKLIQAQKQLNQGMEIQTQRGAIGISRSKVIGDIICNSTLGDAIGVYTDTFLAHSVALPKLEKGNILITIKSCSRPEDICKKPSCYMKDFVQGNISLDPQLNCFSALGELTISSIPKKYYAILAYHFSTEEHLDYVKIVFFDSEIKHIIEEIDVPKQLLGNKEYVIDSKMKSIVSKGNIKSGDLKDKLKIKAR